jgi:hypothetical protein
MGLGVALEGNLVQSSEEASAEDKRNLLDLLIGRFENIRSGMFIQGNLLENFMKDKERNVERKKKEEYKNKKALMPDKS